MSDPIDFGLTLFLKETQLQHGLRADDYVRYSHYVTRRLATLRRQLGLSNEKKKFLKKGVTVHNASDPRHLMLLALYADRCWATAESLREQRQSFIESQSKINKPSGGIPPSDQYRKRLNKSVKWAEKLNAIAKSVASAHLQAECEAYLLETIGRVATSQKDFKKAKASFMSARAIYFDLLSRRPDPEEANRVLSLKVSEMDDRVVYSMQQLREDLTAYNPASLALSGCYDATTTLHWNGHELRVTNIKVRDALREARRVPLEAIQAKLLEGDDVVPVGQVHKLLDLMDRRMSSYNDALSHAQQDHRSALEDSRSKTELQLVVHYLLYEVAQSSMQRSLFLAEVRSRCFHATERVLASSSASPINAKPGSGGKVIRRARAHKKGGITPAQFASPLEVVRLYEAAMNAVEQMEILPGISGQEDLEVLSGVCRAGKFLYMGEAFRVSGSEAEAEACYREVATLLDQVSTPNAIKIRELAEQTSLEMKVNSILRQFSSSSTPTALCTQTQPEGVNRSYGVTEYLAEVSGNEIVVAKNVVRFPPDYQIVACKPVFVDIASTYLDFPCSAEDLDLPEKNPLVKNPSHCDTSGTDKTNDNATKPASTDKKWRWGWSW
ncbi:unnamed protein product [Phytomonas sp. Hart1]|nr:unnamed protein product [Phytomonas sp. Hart1]|eukprot:CCW66506.1 unnamed protein product [Phytomonas sp. isolate Hart1]